MRITKFSIDEFLNTSSPIVFIFESDGISTRLSFVHPEKTQLPIIVTCEGIIILLIEVCSKASSSIDCSFESFSNSTI